MTPFFALKMCLSFFKSLKLTLKSILMVNNTSCHEIWKILQQLNCKNAKFHTIQGIKITKEIGIK